MAHSARHRASTICTSRARSSLDPDQLTLVLHRTLLQLLLLLDAPVPDHPSRSPLLSSVPAHLPAPSPTDPLHGSQLPPPWLVALLDSHYTVHLLFPSQSPFPLPAAYTSFDSRRLLFHSQGEGIIHVARVLGGTFVTVLRDVEGEELPIGNEARLEGVDLDRLVKDVRTFVGGMIVVTKEGGKQETVERLEQESRGVTVVEGWEALVKVLRLES